MARLRTDYVHELQERYRTQLNHLAETAEHASGAERVRLAKQQKKLQEQALEIEKYEERCIIWQTRTYRLTLMTA